MNQPKKLLQNTAFTLLCIFFLVYAIYHIGNAFREKTELFTVTKETLEHTVDLSGYIFRDETVLYGSGIACSYNYKNGEKVGQNRAVAKTYYADNGKLAEKISVLRDKIDILEKSCSVLHIDIDEIDSKIAALRAEITLKSMSGDTSFLQSSEEELLILLHKRSLAQQNKNNYAADLAILTAELDSLLAASAYMGTDVMSPQSGYFYSYTDGLESKFSINALQNLTFESFDALASSKPTKNDAAIGKIASLGKWYFVCKTDITKAEEIVADQSYNSIFINNACSDRLPLTVEDKIFDYQNEEVILIFSCSYIPEDFDFARNQNVKIIVAEVDGLRIPSSALRVENGNTIVYIIKEGVCRPRKINIIFEKTGYCIVSMPENAEYLDVYDRIITGEKNLYDGMVINY